MIGNGNKISGVGTSPVQFYTARGKTAKAEKRPVSHFDSITLSGDRPNAFATQLTSKLTQEVRATATPGRLNTLAEQVASGEYKPDAMSIARRMLLLAEEG